MWRGLQAVLLGAFIMWFLPACSSLQYPVDVYIGPPAHETGATNAVHWFPLFQGVEITRYSFQQPPLQVWAVRVDLDAPGVRPVVTRSNGPRPLETDGRTTAEFLTRSHVSLAVNASPFTPVNNVDGSPRDILGISESNGERYSQPQGNDGALLFDREGRAWIVGQAALESGGHGLPANIRNAVGGFSIILHHGRNIGATDHRHPRTAAGVSRDHRYLYLVVIDGRQLAWSVGVTTRELAAWLAYFGAWDGLNLDGGGSTALVVRGPGGKPVVVNSPIDGMVPGRLRIVGNNLGIMALPLSDGAIVGRTLARVAVRSGDNPFH